MEALRFLRGMSTPPIALGIDHRRHHPTPPANLAAVASRAAPAFGVVEAEAPAAAGSGKGENWVMKILRVGSMWEEGRKENGGEDICVQCGGGDGDEGCLVEETGSREERAEFDRDSFSRLLRRVSLAEAELYAKMSYLGNLAYTIPKIKAASLLKYHGLRIVTSSLEKKVKFSNAEETTIDQDKNTVRTPVLEGDESQSETSSRVSSWVAYQIVASAASYLQSRTRSILPSRTQKAESGHEALYTICSIEDESVASFVATTSSVTAVVAGKEEMKNAVAEGLNSARSSPCEWFICDEESCGTRYFIVQGSETLASWQTNLLFEPIEFEGLDVLVHRGIYEAAKGIYQQMLPEVQDHLTNHGNTATFRFTGHSLGGSLALLVSLMLLIRRDAPLWSLLPVVTFGAPSVMCGGDYLLRKLGLPQSHVQSITMHRDIVPRAFSCHYPDYVANILKAVNRNFRNHPCLQNQSLLYAPMGKLLILQPEEKFSPHHHLLPPGCGFYVLGHSLVETENSMKLLHAAQFAFLDSPHPLEILSDRSAYGSKGTIFRDHDMNSYLRSLRAMIRLELKHIRKTRRKNRRLMWWPLVSTQGVKFGLTPRQNARLADFNRHQFSFAGFLHGSKQTLTRFARMVASQHVHVFFMFLYPTRFLMLRTLSLVEFC
ncbi:hypothetical protein AXF42_Ash012802 [Apostasia shenzhenica]|uniref:Fungal lipase-type domain-containing protein n=1 Tax=Apostasia shenzhenica TaxID=1088818 RepID=A0A2I0AM86_9ASPA|nr:hypothetical protein AXF42_Ash012802 [Apostasia shenzhenica]